MPDNILLVQTKWFGCIYYI